MEISNWIDIISILINIGIAIYVVKGLQNSLNNKRFLKDHFIKETIILRDDYFQLIDKILSNKAKPKELNSDFKNLNIKTISIISILNRKFNIDKNYLTSYQIELKNLVTELDEFVYNFKGDQVIQLESESILKLIKFKQQNIGTFNNLIIDINDH